MISVENKQELMQQVEKSLDTMRPYLVADGGNVEVVDITEEMEVLVKLVGSCENCPQSYMTMRAGIEEAIKKSVPGVNAVRAINVNVKAP